MIKNRYKNFYYVGTYMYEEDEVKKFMTAASVFLHKLFVVKISHLLFFVFFFFSKQFFFFWKKIGFLVFIVSFDIWNSKKKNKF